MSRKHTRDPSDDEHQYDASRRHQTLSVPERITRAEGQVKSGKGVLRRLFATRHELRRDVFERIDTLLAAGVSLTIIGKWIDPTIIRPVFEGEGVCVSSP
jgi:hypothetical protein